MKKMLFFLILISFISCSSQSCDDIPSTFTTYKEVKSMIDETDFSFEDSVDTSKSSWIRNAKFYSCNNKTGYFVLTTDRKKYVFVNMPVSLWKRFKHAESFGKFYNRYIRNKYHLYLEN